MNQVNWLKITGIAFLLHVILVILSILVVFIYSLAINPGHEHAFYEAFAVLSAPYVATIGGAILVFWLVIKLNKDKEINPFIIGLGLPLIYVLIDIILLMLMSAEWMDSLGGILGLNLLKMAGGVLGAYRVKLLQQS